MRIPSINYKLTSPASHNHPMSKGGFESMIDRLLSQIGPMPHLEGARCTARPALFEPRRLDEGPRTWATRRGEAVRVCLVCPALTGCREWLETMPRHSMTGIVGGRVLP